MRRSRWGLVVVGVGCAPVVVPDAVTPGVGVCDGGGGRVEALGTLGVTVDDAPVGPWRAEVLVRPEGDRVTAETFACVLGQGGQIATWSVAFHLPSKLDDPVALTPELSPGVDGFEGTFAVGDDPPGAFGASATAEVTAFDAIVGRLAATVHDPSLGGSTPFRVDAALDLRW